jgi:hypothetical protein
VLLSFPDDEKGGYSMKKLVCALIAVTLVVSLAISSAMAAPIDMTVQCVNTTTYSENPYTWDSTTHSGKVYIYHTVNHSVKYNNRFKVMKDGVELTIGWVTPDQNVPLSSSQITTNDTIGLKARGNTYYYELQGVSSVQLGGTFGWPL